MKLYHKKTEELEGMVKYFEGKIKVIDNKLNKLNLDKSSYENTINDILSTIQHRYNQEEQEHINACEVLFNELAVYGLNEDEKSIDYFHEVYEILSKDIALFAKFEESKSNTDKFNKYKIFSDLIKSNFIIRYDEFFITKDSEYHDAENFALFIEYCIEMEIEYSN